MRRQKKRNKKNSETSSDSEASSSAAAEEDRKKKEASEVSEGSDKERESGNNGNGNADGWAFEADDIDVNKMIDEVVGGGCPVSRVRHQMLVRELPDMMSSISLYFLTPSSPLYAFGSDLHYEIQPTSLITSAFL